MESDQMRLRVLSLVYDRYSNYDPQQRGIYVRHLEETLELEPAHARGMLYALAHEGYLFLGGNDYVGVDFERVDALEQLLAEAGNEKARAALEVRRRILRRCLEAVNQTPPRAASVAEIAAELKLSEVQRTAHFSILRRQGALAGDFTWPRITETGKRMLADDVMTPEPEGLPQPVESFPPALTARRTVVFLDMVTSTTIGAIWGDEALLELQRILIEAVRSNLVNWQPTNATFLGDGYMVAFDDETRLGAKQALGFCFRLLADLERYNNVQEKASSPNRIYLRVGIHGGEVKLMDGDIMGIAIAKAQRIQALDDDLIPARPWEDQEGPRLLMSEEIKYQLESIKFHVPVEGPYNVRLKGLTGSHFLYKVHLDDMAKQ